MKIDLTKEELEISISMLGQIATKLDQAEKLLILRNKYKEALKKGET